jgi:uncharacterized membrane protein
MRAVVRHLRVRLRLVSAAALGLGVLPVLPRTLSAATRALVAWDAAAALYLVLAGAIVARANVERMRWRARREDDGAAVVLGLAVGAAVASLAAIVLELVGARNAPPRQQTQHLALAGLTIVLSWCFVHTAFALHYAHEFYVDRRRGHPPCLQFPGGGRPDYVDFLYFSFVIGTTSQTADVSIASPSMRRLALLHGVIAFLFNTTLLALTVNIAASLI